MKKIILVLSVFMLGFLTNEIGSRLIPVLHAHVNEMGWRGLVKSKHFRKAVWYLIEDCSVDGSSISC